MPQTFRRAPKYRDDEVQIRDLIIKKVKANGVLWDVRHADYKKSKTPKCWEDIYKELIDEIGKDVLEEHKGPFTL
jgi:hypothetical protein